MFTEKYKSDAKCRNWGDFGRSGITKAT